MHITPGISKDSSSRFHRELDSERLQAAYDRWCMTEEDWKAAAPYVTDGAEVLVIEHEQARQSVLDRLTARCTPVDGSVPTDAFFLDRGRAPDPIMTRVGGIPYWPKHRPWPVDSHGDPMVFVAQINFSDSHDLLDTLPGELLVIFREQRDDLHGFWLAANLSDVVGPEDIPETVCINSIEQYGVVQRLHDPPTGPKPYSGIKDDDVLHCIKVGGKHWTERPEPPKDAQLLFQLFGLSIVEWFPAEDELEEVEYGDLDDEFGDDDVCDECEGDSSDRTIYSNLPLVNGYLTHSGELVMTHEYLHRWDDFVDEDGYRLNRFGLWFMHRLAPEGGVIAFNPWFRWVLMKKA